MRKWRANNPLLATYTIVKGNAKRRNIPFYITLEDFGQLCKITNYLELKGRNATDLSLDRIVDEAGYVMGNVRVITVSENTKKRNARKTWSIRVTRQPDDPF